MTTLQDFIALRRRLGLSARAASLALGLHENYISRVERGERGYRHIYYLALVGMKCEKSVGPLEKRVPR